MNTKKYALLLLFLFGSFVASAGKSNGDEKVIVIKGMSKPAALRALYEGASVDGPYDVKTELEQAHIADKKYGRPIKTDEEAQKVFNKYSLYDSDESFSYVRGKRIDVKFNTFPTLYVDNYNKKHGESAAQESLKLSGWPGETSITVPKRISMVEAFAVLYKNAKVTVKGLSASKSSNEPLINEPLKSNKGAQEAFNAYSSNGSKYIRGKYIGIDFEKFPNLDTTMYDMAYGKNKAKRILQNAFIE